MGSLGYVVMRQRGSHVRLEIRNDRGTWTETVPLHREVARGTLRGILKRLTQATGLELDELVERLAEF
jgi:predicted RNA binding protein YcfA (HicA-like mRNA interferase family)